VGELSPARYSWMKPITAFRTTIVIIATASFASPITPETTAAARSTMIIKSLNWSMNIQREVRPFPSASTLGPCS